MFTKKKRRSGHGFFSTTHGSAISDPSHFVKVSGMSSVDEPIAATVDSAYPGVADGRLEIGEHVVPEPLVEDVHQVQYAHHDWPVQEPDSPTPDKRSSYQALGSYPVATPSHEEPAPPPPDFTRRGIHIPMRTSSNTANKRRWLRSSSVPSQSMPTTSDSGSHHAQSMRSDADSIRSYETQASSIATNALPPLQQKGIPDDLDRLSPLLEDDPKSFDLISPNEAGTTRGFDLEVRSEQLFSKQHLEAIFKDTPSLLRFTNFLSAARPKSVGILIYYLDALKAIRAINYANAVAEALEPIDHHEFTELPPRPTINAVLEDKAQQAFDVLVREDLPAFIAHTFIQVVSVSIQKRVTGNLPPMLREASEGLAEVFCLSDPSRSDNPIIFASEEFHRTTQYGVGYAIGRNCRFLQGPRTNRNSVQRLKKACVEGKETSEVFLNYRRDGSPFMNLLMMAPLLDSRGNMRYFIGAQVDVSGLVKDGTDLEAFQRYIAVQEGREPDAESKDEFQELGEMFNHAELDTVRKHGGNMHRNTLEDRDDARSVHHKPRVLIKDLSGFDGENTVASPIHAEGRLAGVYKNYLLIRPAPSLRILFVSPSLRVPGILQSRFLDRVGGSERVRNSLADALSDGSRGVTAKIRWLSTAAASLDDDHVEEGRPRWIHCTPLLGQSGAVGVWMVVLVDDEKSQAPHRRFRQAPPIQSDVRARPQQQSHRQPHYLRPGTPDTVALDSDAELNMTTGRQPLSNGGIPRHVALDALSRSHSIKSERRGVNEQRAVYPSYSPARTSNNESVAHRSSGTATSASSSSDGLDVAVSPNGVPGTASSDMFYARRGLAGSPSAHGLTLEALADVEKMRRLLGHV